MGFFDNKFKLQPSTVTPVTDFPSNGDGMSAPTQPAPSPQVQATDVTQQTDTTDVQTPTPPSVDSPAAQAASTTTTAPIDTNELVADNQPSFTQQPTEEVTKVNPNQGISIDWSRPYSEIEQNPLLQQMKPYDIMRDFEKNGNGDWASFMPWLSNLGDADKTVAANAALQKKAENQAKWEQLGNLFQHIGNFFGTAIGAPEQKVESAQELTDRQRKLREGTDALRQKGYDQMMVNIWKDRQNKQAQMQAEAAAKAKEAQAAYYGSQKNQVDALTPVKVEEVNQSARQHSTGADLNVSKKQTEEALRGKKGKLLDAQANNANAGAADHAAGVAVKVAQRGKILAETEKTNRSNQADKEADDFNYNYVNDPTFKKYVNQWASHNGMAIGGNDGTGGTWSNKYNRQQAYAWAKAKMKRDRTPPSRRPNNGGGGNKVPPSRRGGSKVPPSRR